MKNLFSFTKSISKNPVIKITYLIIAGLLLPILSYLVFQFVEFNRNEEIIESIYENQLESILFSVNTHSWDVFDSWVTELTGSYNSPQFKNISHSSDKIMKEFIGRYPQIIGSVVQYGNEPLTKTWKKYSPVNHISIIDIWNKQAFDKILANSKSKIQRMIKRSIRGYTKPLMFHWNHGDEKYISLLIFPIIRNINSKDEVLLAGLFIDDIIYINEVTARKFASIGDSAFVFTIRDVYSKKMLYSTEEFPEGAFEKSADLWILPDMEISIKYRGATLQELSSSRIKLDLLFLFFINLALIVGIYYIIKNIKTQISLAKMQTDFAANVSHELRTPLAVIRMFAETLEMGRVNNDKTHYYYKSIMNESRRLTQLINNILDFSSIESKKKTYTLSPTNLKILLKEILEMYHFHLIQKGFTLETKFADNIPDLQLDAEAIKQVIINLLDNAVKFSGEEKRIIVSLDKQPSKIILSITDFGIGIAQDEQKKIFNKFYRVEETKGLQAKGNGLGLVLVKNIIDFHGGNIKLNSRLGKGATFSLIFKTEDKI